MHLHSFHITNFRRLKDVHIDLDPKTSIFVGSNNSGKTSATHIFQFFLGSSRERFSVHDFSADRWAIFDAIGSDPQAGEPLPTIRLDLWFEVEGSDLYRVIKILPSMEWNGVALGIRMEFAPKDAAVLLANYREAKSKAGKSAVPKGNDTEGFHPWPETLTDYLSKRLSDEYKTFYYVLDRGEFDADFRENGGYVPQELGDGAESGGSIVESLLRVDFLHAQRHLSDAESRGRAEDLSKRLNRFYKRNLQKYGEDFKAVAALAASEAQLNTHLSAVFEPTLRSLNTLGYPGFADPYLVIKSAFDPESILTRNASVHYALRDPGRPVQATFPTLPDKYNGLGFKNLIYMVIELLDFDQRWADEEENRPPLHIVFIEEPEAHLHVQLQQVFIRKIREILPDESPLFSSQLIVTTHSPHIIYESNFRPIRYFRRFSRTSPGNYSHVLNLSNFYDTEEDTRDFLLQYMKLTHCDLFFADAAVFVEGNVERLLLPLMIEKEEPQLKSSYLSILELGGAFAHKFRNLIHFLGLTALVITDLDSVLPKPEKGSEGQNGKAIAPLENQAGDEEDQEEGVDRGVCMCHAANAVTSNQTLIQWLPKLTTISDLLAANTGLKRHPPTDIEPANISVAYQTRQLAAWKGEKAELAGRTFEDAFAYENLEWCQDIKRKSLHLRVVTKNTSLLLDEVVQKIHDRVNGSGFNKTDFALALMMTDPAEWVAPRYISEGLRWLKEQLFPAGEEPPTTVSPIKVEAAQ
jgi:predicted ATP-dependent endonuclease of OLD family